MDNKTIRIAARLPFMSYEPRPYRRPSSTRASNGASIVSTPTVSIPGFLTSAALAIGVIATFALGVVPAPLIDLTRDAAQFVR